MILLDVEQGTPEWDDGRLAIPTASKFKEVITTKGVLSASRNKLLWELVEEKITGVKKKTYKSAAMQRGSDLEPEAVAYFELITGLKVDRVGICYENEHKKHGCSPDGLIGLSTDRRSTDEGLEIKCPSLEVHWDYVTKGVLPTEHFTQVQGSMKETGAKRWHFLSYFPGIKHLHVIVERDEIWIAKLGKALDDFVIELDETYKLLTEDK